LFGPKKKYFSVRPLAEKSRYKIFITYWCNGHFLPKRGRECGFGDGKVAREDILIFKKNKKQ
jgi:hypothetical protein